MSNDEPQAPQQYAGWPYRQGLPSSPAGPPQHYSQWPQQGYPTPGPQDNAWSNPEGYGPQAPYQPGRNWPDELSMQYDPNLSMNMDTSLGYGQTMGFRAISLPQFPSQPRPDPRQARLQQLQKERMRLRPRHGQPDIAKLLQRRRQGRGGPENSVAIPSDIRSGPLTGVARRSPTRGLEAAPYASVPAIVAKPRPSGFLPDMQFKAPLAAAPMQDTGAVQRVALARASFLITGSLIASNVLGLLQTLLFTYVFNTSSLGTAYLQAYLIPNLIYTVVTGGALSSAFIPVFTSYMVGQRDEKTAWHVTSSALNLAAVVMIALAAIAALLAPVLVPLYNVDVPPQEMGLIIALTRIMLLQAVVLGSGVIVSAVLNARQDFTHTAIGTVLYNVGLILGLLPGFIMTLRSGTHDPLEAAVYSATWGVVLAAILQVGAQIPGLPKIGMHYRFVFDWRHPGIRRIATQMIPRIINSIMLSFSTAVDRFWLTSLAAILPKQPGLVTEYFQAFSIFLMPVSIFGSAVSTAAFPTLARYVAQRRFDRVRSVFLETLRGILFLAIPSSAGLMVLSFPIVQVLLHFDMQGVYNTSISLFSFALGLPALAAVEILTRSFYALQDSKTPVVISVAQFIFKIILSVFLVNLKVFGPQWGMAGLALSTSVAGVLEALVLFVLLYRRIGSLDLRSLTVFLFRVLLAVGVMAVALVFLRLLLDHVIDTTRMPLTLPGVMGALLKLLIELGVGTTVFLVVARFQNMEEMNAGLVRRVINLLRIPWL